ncbi:MAG TPA: molybdopterin-dependent oxidoreductase [Polyangiaceae bacterium]|nr:molybdopterin-dependent oxidoreductase [Polyangiaceae bacterium]
MATSAPRGARDPGLGAVEHRKTLCNRDCPDVCGIVATVEGGRVTRLRGDPDHPITRGFLCHRTSHFLETQYDPARLTTPLWRARLDEEFRPISWDEALTRAAEALLRIRAESGPAAIFHYRSGGSLGLLKHLTDYFFERFGPVTQKRGDICSGAGDAAQMLDFGEEDSRDLSELKDAKHIFLWGKNAFVSSPHLIPLLNEARRRGTTLALVDPIHHKTASICDLVVQPRPGGDFALAMAVGRRLFDLGLTDPEAATYCDHLEELRALCSSRTLEAWREEADVPLEAIDALARRLGGGPTTVFIGWGMGRRRNGGAIVRALDALVAITGNLGVPGGGASFYFKRRGAFDLSFIGQAPPPRTVCEPLFGAEVLGMSDPPIRAVWITAGNPVAMLPESRTIERALQSRELVVVVDAFLTDTARCAHLVLPTTTLLEADDLLGSYGHSFIGAAVPVVPPPEGVKSDLEIVQALAARVGLEGDLAGDARAWKERLLAKVAPHGLTPERLAEGAVPSPIAPRALFEGRVFPTPSGKVNLLYEAPTQGAPRVTEEHPLLLTALSTERSQSSQWVRGRAGADEHLAIATVHPDAAANAGLRDGDEALVEGSLGALRVRVRCDARQRRDVLLLPKGGHLRDGRCANALIGARTTDLGEGGALHDEPVRLRRPS